MQNEYVKSVTDTTSGWYKEFASNDIAKNVVGMLIGLSMCVGFINMSYVVWLMSMGLYLFAVKEVVRMHTRDNSNSNSKSMAEIVYLMISLTGLQLFYQIIYKLAQVVSIPFLPYIVNFAALFLLTRIVSDVNTHYSTREVEPKPTLKDFNFHNATRGTYSQSVLNHVGFATKLYTINNVFVDNVILNNGASAMVTLFSWIEKGLFFAIGYAQKGYKMITTQSAGATQDAVEMVAPVESKSD